MVTNPPGPTVIGYEVAGVITIPGDVLGVAAEPGWPGLLDPALPAGPILPPPPPPPPAPVDWNCPLVLPPDPPAPPPGPPAPPPPPARKL